MAYFLGFGDGILISFGIICVAILLCIVNGRSKGLQSVLVYLLIAFFFLAVFLSWPVKGPNEPDHDSKIKTDIIIFPRVIFLFFLPFFLIYLFGLFVRHNLFHVVRAQSTAHRHGKGWIIDAKIKNMR